MFTKLFTSRPVVPLTTRLETSRLLLRPPTRDDLQTLRELTARNADHLRPWSPASPPHRNPLAPTELRAQIERQREEWLKDRTYAFLIEHRDKHTLIGRMTLSQVVRGPLQGANLGYWIDREYQGNGLMTEAALKIVQFAFSSLQLHRIQAGTLPHNLASQKVLQKVGFRREGYAKNYLNIAGRWQDHILFALTIEDQKSTKEVSMDNPSNEEG